MAADSASLLLEVDKIKEDKKITLVSRGPGLKFHAKEGALIRAFNVAGIDIAKVVYIDSSKKALDKSVKDGMTLLPKAEHEVIQADIFDPETKKQYTVAGLEVGTCFGLTPMNAEGRNDASPPLTSIENNISGIRNQMEKDAHFIAVYDHNNDASSLETSYLPADKFLKNMLAYHFEKDDLSNVEYVNKFNPKSYILGHAYKFDKDETFNVGGKEVKVASGVTLWFNNSVKLSKELTEQCHEHVQFSYPRIEKSIMAINNRLGYHHLIAS